MDSVVATLVLCSVSDVTQTLNGKLPKPLKDLTGYITYLIGIFRDQAGAETGWDFLIHRARSD